MPLNQYAVEIENGRTASENGMVIEGQQFQPQQVKDITSVERLSWS